MYNQGEREGTPGGNLAKHVERHGQDGLFYKAGRTSESNAVRRFQGWGHTRRKGLQKGNGAEDLLGSAASLSRWKGFIK